MYDYETSKSARSMVVYKRLILVGCVIASIAYCFQPTHHGKTLLRKHRLIMCHYDAQGCFFIHMTKVFLNHHSIWFGTIS